MATNIIAGGLTDFYAACRAPGVDGCILTFTASHPRWSFAKTDATGRVTAVAEKRPISKQATAGLVLLPPRGRFHRGGGADARSKA